MTVPPAAAGQPRDSAFTARFFRALYQEFDLHTINDIYVVVPKGTPWFAGPSLGDIARQISEWSAPVTSQPTSIGRQAPRARRADG